MKTQIMKISFANFHQYRTFDMLLLIPMFTNKESNSVQLRGLVISDALFG